MMELTGRKDYEIVGMLTSLWHFALRNAAQTGDLKPWGDAAIERAARWDGEPKLFVKALREVTFLDDSTVHGWENFTLHYKLILERRERQTAQVRKRVRRFREKRNAYRNAPVTPCNAATKPNHTIPNLTIPNQTKEEKGRAAVAALVPEDLKPNLSEIFDWLEYKKQRAQSYKPKGLEALWRVFRDIPASKRREAVDHSMANNYSGLFQKSGGSNGSTKAGYAEPVAGKYQD